MLYIKLILMIADFFVDNICEMTINVVSKRLRVLIGLTTVSVRLWKMGTEDGRM